MEPSRNLTPAWPLPDNDFSQLLWNAYKPSMPKLSHTEFGKGFLFGTASSAYQYEGAADDGGKGPSIWDKFTEKHSGNVLDYSDGKVAVDFYNRYEEDIQLMKEMGLKAFRFSISWSRLLPNGKKESLNPCGEGVRFYNNLIDDLRANGIEPFITLFHFDTPQALEDEYKGFLNEKIAYDFADYAEVCFDLFGDRVKYWITFNEPWSFCYGGYGTGALAPGRRSTDLRHATEFIQPYTRFFPWHQLALLTEGDSGREPYQVAHNLLFAHGMAVQRYRQKYKKSQKGLIGITNVSVWTLPFSNKISPSRDDQKAAFRYLDFMFGWFMEPLTRGDYPDSMKQFVTDNRLPKFTPDRKKLVMGSFDFLGLNYYTSYYAIDASDYRTTNPNYMTDTHVILKVEREGVPIGEKGGVDWLYSYPKGIMDLLIYIKKKYGDLLIYITENGVAEPNKFEYPPKNLHLDVHRINYHYGHLKFIKEAKDKHGVNVKGYFVWSFLDNFEWSNGYTDRFGIHHVDYTQNLKRQPKCSVEWFKNLLQ